MRLYQLIGEEVNRLRRALGLTQAALASRAKVARASIANLESGRQKVPLEQLVKIAGALDVDYRALLPEPIRLESPQAERITPDSVGKKAPMTAALIERLQKEDDA